MLGPTRISLITYVMPIVGIVLGVLVLDETIDSARVVGTAIILGGVGAGEQPPRVAHALSPERGGR